MQRKHIFAVLIALVLIAGFAILPASARHYSRPPTQPAVCVEPISEFSSSATSGFSPLYVKFTSDSTGTYLKYQWSFRSHDVAPSDRVWIQFSTLENPSMKFNPGQYDIRLNVTNGCGESSLVKSAYIRTDYIPKVSFTASPQYGYSPLTVKLTSTSIVPTTNGEIVHYMWKYNDGSGWKIFSESSVDTRVFLTGRYDISLMVTNDGGSVTKTIRRFIVVK
jgi:PKD repeat protein